MNVKQTNDVYSYLNEDTIHNSVGTHRNSLYIISAADCG
jgi:hypothetical protein